MKSILCWFCSGLLLALLLGCVFGFMLTRGCLRFLRAEIGRGRSNLAGLFLFKKPAWPGFTSFNHFIP